jgi:hypothetical protein
MKVDLREIGWDDTEWIHLAQDGEKWSFPLKTVMNLRGSIKCWEILE